MKAISLWQPWATLIVIGAKQFETRSWRTDYRGRILIHAAKRNTQEERDYFMMPEFHKALNAAGYYSFYDLPLGQIVGAATIVAMHPTRSIVETISETEERFGNYGPDRWAWEMKNPAMLTPPVPCRGMQQIFTIPDDAAASVRVLTSASVDDRR